MPRTHQAQDKALVAEHVICKILSVSLESMTDYYVQRMHREVGAQAYLCG